MVRRTLKGCLFAVLFLALLGTAVILFAIVQARHAPVGRADYVAMGSSFAAGAGLGPLQEASPYLCARSINGYPQHLARTLGLSIVDMSCGGAVTKHLLRGGQFFQGAQLWAIDRDTRLVTITVGGNDIGYIGDLSQLAARNSDTLYGWLARRFWSGPGTTSERDYAKLRRELLGTLRAVRARAPRAAIVVATYPTILPPAGTCAQVGLTLAEAERMRTVAGQLAATTRSAARAGGALLVDMHAIGASHHACSGAAWTSGWANGGIAPFHPTLAGAKATARAIARTLRRSPAAIAPVGEDDAAGHQAGSVGREE